LKDSLKLDKTQGGLLEVELEDKAPCICVEFPNGVVCPNYRCRQAAWTFKDLIEDVVRNRQMECEGACETDLRCFTENHRLRSDQLVLQVCGTIYIVYINKALTCKCHIDYGRVENIEISATSKVRDLNDILTKRIENRFFIMCDKQQLCEGRYLCSLSPEHLGNIRIMLQSQFIIFRIGGVPLPRQEFDISVKSSEWEKFLKKYISFSSDYIVFKYRESTELPDIWGIEDLILDIETQGKAELIVPIYEVINVREVAETAKVPLEWSVLDFINSEKSYDFEIEGKDLMEHIDLPIRDIVFGLKEHQRIKKTFKGNRSAHHELSFNVTMPSLRVTEGSTKIVNKIEPERKLEIIFNLITPPCDTLHESLQLSDHETIQDVIEYAKRLFECDPRKKYCVFDGDNKILKSEELLKDIPEPRDLFIREVS
jgi:hypothetical protein